MLASTGTRYTIAQERDMRELSAGRALQKLGGGAVPRWGRRRGVHSSLIGPALCPYRDGKMESIDDSKNTYTGRLSAAMSRKILLPASSLRRRRTLGHLLPWGGGGPASSIGEPRRSAILDRCDR